MRVGSAVRVGATFGLLTVMAAAVAAYGARQRPEDAASFRSDSSELVVLPVVVTDKGGRFVSDLPPGRFSIYDNGRQQPVSLFTREDAPVTIGIIVDTSGSMGTKLPYVEAATLALARGSNPDDEIFAVAFNDTVREVLPGARILAGDIDHLQTALAALVSQGRTALYDALTTGLDRLEAAPGARKVLVLISDGGDNTSRASLHDVLARAQQSNVSIYTIGLFETADSDRNLDVLKALARATGAERFLPKSAGPMMQACQRIAREIRSQYTLGFVPPDHDGAYHSVRVRIEPTDFRRLTVRTRPGYFAAAATP